MALARRMDEFGEEDKGFTLYLMKGGVLLGNVVYRPFEGYRFHPNTARHKASRKAHASCAKAIPRWADALSTDLLSAEEFARLVKAIGEGA